MSNQNTDSGWRQVNLWCDDGEAAEQMALTHLGPLLTEAEDSSSSICWWLVRKGPSWRLRLRLADGRGDTATAVVEWVTTALMDQGVIRRWAEVVYEPEVHAFGGVEAMAVAHDLFSADSRHLLTHLAQARTDHRRELGLLLGTRLLHAAGQDWYEQGDIWEQVAAHRDRRAPPGRAVTDHGGGRAPAPHRHRRHRRQPAAISTRLAGGLPARRPSPRRPGPARNSHPRTAGRPGPSSAVHLQPPGRLRRAPAPARHSGRSGRLPARTRLGPEACQQLQP